VAYSRISALTSTQTSMFGQLALFGRDFVHQELQGLPKPLLSDKDDGMRGVLDGECRGSHAESVLQPSSLAIFCGRTIELSVPKKNRFLKLERKDQLSRYSITRKDFAGKS
jgi:hypothetical protein